MYQMKYQPGGGVGAGVRGEGGDAKIGLIGDKKSSENLKDNGGNNKSGQNVQLPPPQQMRSPQEILQQGGGGGGGGGNRTRNSSKDKRVLDSLLDFFGV